MRKCHIAGLAVVGACALVSVTAVAGSPPFADPFSPMLHYQFKEKSEVLNAGGCESSSDGTFCWNIYVGSYPGGFMSFYETQAGETGYRYRFLQCYSSVPGTFDVGGAARVARYEALIDVAMQGCSNFGYYYDYNTGQAGEYTFPDFVLINALFRSPAVSNSSNSQGHSSDVSGLRENYSCNFDEGSNFQDGSVEINGSSVPMEWSFANTNRCHRTGKQ